VKRLFFILFITSQFFLIAEDREKSQILYMMHVGDSSGAWERYNAYATTLGKDDYDLLQELSMSILEKGASSSDPEIQLLTLFGAGISINEKNISILENALYSNNPQLQIVALNFLSKQHNDYADEALRVAMASPYVLVRLEAIHSWALQKHPDAVPQAEALMAKLGDELKAIFPQIFATIGTERAIRILRRLMNDPDEKVRIEAVLHAAQFHRDDLLPQIRTLASHHNNPQQEACATALGIMKDSFALQRLESLAKAPALNVKLAAWQALYSLGQYQWRDNVIQEALKGELLAVALLSKMDDTEDVLAKLCNSKNLQIRINAAIALLEKQDPRCLPGLYEVLVDDARDLSLVKIYSQGKSLTAWKAISSSTENLKDEALIKELSISIREAILRKTIDLPEEHFLRVAKIIFAKQQNDLIPSLVSLLENLGSQEAIDLLKQHQQKLGAPLIRRYCTLALYRLKVPGPYSDQIQDWVREQKQVDLIRFRPYVPLELRDKESSYQLTPEETSRLLIESIEALARSQDRSGLNVIIETIQTGNKKNSYALAGLLMRATQ
jgi:HEAT repeat protein